MTGLGVLARWLHLTCSLGLVGLVTALLLAGRAERPTELAWESRTMRWLPALAVLVLTIGKVFLHDLWNLGALYRVGSIVGLAVALLAVSFLTQRYVFAKRAR